MSKNIKLVHEPKPNVEGNYDCPWCDGILNDTTENEFGVCCTECSYPYPEEEEEGEVTTCVQCGEAKAGVEVIPTEHCYFCWEAYLQENKDDL